MVVIHRLSAQHKMEIAQVVLDALNHNNVSIAYKNGTVMSQEMIKIRKLLSVQLIVLMIAFLTQMLYVPKCQYNYMNYVNICMHCICNDTGRSDVEIFSANNK